MDAGKRYAEKSVSDARSFLHEHSHARPRDQAIALVCYSAVGLV